jgi:hypothetical protein
MFQDRSRSVLLTASLVVATIGGIACAGDNAFPTGLAAMIDRADSRPFDVGTCDSLAAPAGTQVAFRAYATGAQIYRWNGTAWAFVEPEASLFAATQNRGFLGHHFAGPTWQLTNGEFVKATVNKRCNVGAGDIQWLLLNVTNVPVEGQLEGVTHIQRVNTAGGIAPATPGSAAGEEARVPYTTIYVFLRAIE